MDGKQEFQYGEYNEETYGIFRYVKVLSIGEFVPVKSYNGHELFGYRQVRVMTDLFKTSTKIADFRFNHKYLGLAERLEVGKFYKFAFSNVFQNFKTQYSTELQTRVQMDVFDVYKIDYEKIQSEMLDLTNNMHSLAWDEINKRLNIIRNNIG